MNDDASRALCLVVSVAAAAGCVAVTVMARHSRRAVRRRITALSLTATVPRECRVGPRRGPGVPRIPWGAAGRGTVITRRVRAAAEVGLVGLVPLLMVPGTWGAASVSVVVCLGWWRHRFKRHLGTPEASAVVSRTELSLAADLLGACLAAGAEPRSAAHAVGASLGGPLGDRLTAVASELRLGGDPALAWGRLAKLPGADGLARCMERAAVAGAPALVAMDRLSEDCRAECRRTAMARARRAGVLATAPLGLCFLPAFLLVGVVPVLLGLARGLVAGG